MGLFSSDSKNSATAEARRFHTDYGQLLIDGEIIEAGFVVARDTLLFTNKRLIVIEVQGISGRQLEYLSIPYGSIVKFSVQTGSSFDLNAELKLWIGNETVPMEKRFTSELNVYEVQKILAGRVLK